MSSGCHKASWPSSIVQLKAHAHTECPHESEVQMPSHTPKHTWYENAHNWSSVYAMDLVLQKIEPLYFANISCCTCPFELKFGKHLDDEIWNNFGIQLMNKFGTEVRIKIRTSCCVQLFIVCQHRTWVALEVHYIHQLPISTWVLLTSILGGYSTLS